MRQTVESVLRFESFLKFNEGREIFDKETNTTYKIINHQLYTIDVEYDTVTKVVWVITPKEFTDRLMKL